MGERGGAHRILIVKPEGKVPMPVVTVAENEWVPVSPKKDEPSAAVVAMNVAETRLQVEMEHQVFPSAVVTEVSEMPAGNKLVCGVVFLLEYFTNVAAVKHHIGSQVNSCHSASVMG
jgi:hypothetical protein